MSITRAEQLFNLRAVEVAAYHIQPESAKGQQESVQAVQTSHRLDVMYAWLTGKDPDPNGALPSGSSANELEVEWDLLKRLIMDLGCGQGDQTGALAAVLAAHQDKQLGKVTGVDPAPEDYGSPYTIKQAQDHLMQQGELANHLSFILGKTGPDVLKGQYFDTVVMSHSLWYLSSAMDVIVTLKQIREAGVKRLLLAEWALTASHPDSLPHLLAVLIQGQSPLKGGNVQTPQSPEQIKACARRAGWKVKRELTFAPAEKLQDGGWEVYMAREAIKQVESLTGGDTGKPGSAKRRQIQSVLATKYALEEAAQRCGSKTRSMDVWTAVLTLA